MPRTCPRDGAELKTEDQYNIEMDRCHTCNGRWLDYGELDDLEATTGAAEADRRATIAYGEHQSELNCPVCNKKMIAFNYRAYDLELDTCEDRHGFWLDAGEEGRVRDIVEERVRSLDRKASAEAAWGGFVKGLKEGGGGGVWDQITSFFKGRRR